MRNPHQSSRRVSSEMGCQIFVKLTQMTEHEVTPTRINTHGPKHWRIQQGREICSLFKSNVEQTFLEKLKPNQCMAESAEHGIEIFILTGVLSSAHHVYPMGTTWMRFPSDYDIDLNATELGATLYIKSGHLQHARDVWTH
ncbi:cupin domain-containing protein [Acinetobacter sp. CFCC 11171]|uniref:cupin domain-containing protein n=1 Tax=Acinetobacter sp. CFCC 11171 TaxID=1775558 RepID=UPI001D17915A|nr:cupin domain-containing protein [Acinetobacter sp. CFCC 11171]